MYQIDAPGVQVKSFASKPWSRLTTRGPRARGEGPSGRDQTILRVLDLVIAVIAVVFFAPLMIVVSLLVWAQDGGPVFFFHRRVGRGGRHFQCVKFRTMVTEADKRLEHLLQTDPAARREWEADHKLRNDVRITPIGGFLRKSSLDELPQLLNVIRGEMSIVGPRPITDAEICRYGRWYRHYRAVPPGMTGMWQVCGRNEVDYRRRVALDVLYVRQRSLAANLKIILHTIPAVLMRSGAH